MSGATRSFETDLLGRFIKNRHAFVSNLREFSARKFALKNQSVTRFENELCLVDAYDERRKVCHL